MTYCNGGGGRLRTVPGSTARPSLPAPPWPPAPPWLPAPSWLPAPPHAARAAPPRSPRAVA
ncbi:hypothetical protein DDJ31_37330 [Streptomyces griseoviridis]|uniref:Uncharacterized protein n=1 Tax=Streptomyces griseoviridis TaxID=45398 RepID=A0A6G5SRI3_STRGD|nr:hypothetical protein DDJ31_37330 [Streptomyces griseoviridis]